MFGKGLVPAFMLFAAALFARETQDAAAPARLDFSGAEQNTDSREISVSANYALSMVNLSLRYLDSGSILTWRDVYLHGVRVNVEVDTVLFGFDKAGIGAGFSSSVHGYFTDDDINNELASIGVMSSEITSTELSCDLFMTNEMVSPRVRIDFNWLKIENYNLKTIGDKFGQSINGLVNTYDMYKLGFSGGIQAKLAGTHDFYAVLYGYAGLGIYLGMADWIHNTAFQRPVSFADHGLFFRGGTELEFGFKTGTVTFFTKIHGAYEASPGLGIDIQYLTDGAGRQGVFLDSVSASCGAGVKVSL